MSSSDRESRAQDWLKELQRQHFEAHMRPTHTDTMSHLNKGLPHYAQMLEDPLGWADKHIVHRFAIERLLKSMPANCRDTVEHIPVGTLLTSDPNAWAIQPVDFDSGPVIIVDWMLFTFIHEAVKPILRLLDRIPKEERKEMANRIMDCAEYFTTGGRAGKIEIHQYDESLDAMAEGIDLGALIFVIGHEYAHVILGHLDPADVTQGELGFVKYNKSCGQEFAADLKGFDLTRECLLSLERELHGRPISNLPCASPLILMSIIHLLEKFLGFENGSWSRPPAADRRKCLLHPISPMLSEHASGIVTWFERVVNEPWEEVERN